MYEYRCRVVRVIDGDTVAVAVDLGCDVTINLTIRLYGINCPEMKGETLTAARLAKNFTYTWIDDVWSNGEELTLETFKDKKEKYGRYLGVIRRDTPDGSIRSLNAALVEAGHAVRAEY